MGVLEIGSAVPTSAYNLHAQFIIHTVVPKWKDGNSNEYELLSTAYLAALNIADLLNCESIAFPLLASGNNGFDLEIALEIAKNSIESFEGKKLKQVILVIYGSHITSIVKKNGAQYIEFINVKEEEKKRDKRKGKKQIAIILLDNALKAFEFLKDEENYDTLVKIGKQIAEAVKAAKKK